MEVNSGANIYFHLCTAFSYFVLAFQLIAFVSRIKVFVITHDMRNIVYQFRYIVGEDDNLRHVVIALITLFGSFIGLCGGSHIVIYIASIYSESPTVKSIESVVLGSMTVVSVFTALVCIVLFPKLAKLVDQLQTTHIGLLQKITSELQETQHDINNAKLRYISCTAHDLKTPLQSFEYSINLLLDTDLDDNQKYLVKQAEVSVDLMRVTISQAIDISKSLSGAVLTPHRTTISLHALMHRVKVVISGYGSQVPIHFHVSDDVKPDIITDGEWLMQMILNLLTNACKHTESGYINVTTQLSDNNTFLHFKVSDTGIGITPDKQAQIFEPFAQAQKHQSTGTGLGLYSVRMRVQRLGGTCGVHDNRVNTSHGSTFWFKVPYRREDDVVSDMSSGHNKSYSIRGNVKIAPELPLVSNANIALNDIPPSVSNNSPVLKMSATADVASFSLPCEPLSGVKVYNEQSARRTLTAFVVDDMQSIRKMLAQILSKKDFIVECFPNGAQALDAMKLKLVDVVFMDLQMPIMSGPEV